MQYNKDWFHIFFSVKDTFTSKALGHYMCLIPTSGNGNISNQSFAMELDTYPNYEFNVSVNIHIGVDVNSMNSTTEYMQHLLWVQILTVSPTVGPSRLGLRKMVQWRHLMRDSTNVSIPEVNAIHIMNLELSKVFNKYMYIWLSGWTAAARDSWDRIMGVPEQLSFGNYSSTLTWDLVITFTKFSSSAST